MHYTIFIIITPIVQGLFLCIFYCFSPVGAGPYCMFVQIGNYYLEPADSFKSFFLFKMC